MTTDVKRCISDCYACSISVCRHDPPPIYSRPLPLWPWKEVALDFKGFIGGKSGFYYHVVLDTYRRYPEISIVLDTKFETLKPVLEEIWSRWGYPEKMIHDGSPLYNSHDCNRYVE